MAISGCCSRTCVYDIPQTRKGTMPLLRQRFIP
jgi:hypothetical protein